MRYNYETIEPNSLESCFSEIGLLCSKRTGYGLGLIESINIVSREAWGTYLSVFLKDPELCMRDYMKSAMEQSERIASYVAGRIKNVKKKSVAIELLKNIRFRSRLFRLIHEENGTEKVNRALNRRLKESERRRT